MTVPKCCWTFAEDPIVENEIQGHWGNPLSIYAKDRNVMPNGFRHEVMIRRLAVRVDNVGCATGCWAVRVALRQENGKVPEWAWPPEGLPVLLSLKASLFEEEIYSVEVCLTHAAPVVSVNVPFLERASVLTAKSLSQAQVLSAFAHLCKADVRYGLFFPLPYRLHEASLLNLPRSTAMQLILPMAVPPPELDDIEFHDPNCWASTGADIWDPGLVLAAALPQLLDSRPLEILELGAGLSLPGFVAALLGHNCVSTDADDTIASSYASGAANAELLDLYRCRWKAEVIDWRLPPQWVMDRQWDVLLGGDLGWSAAREFALTRGLEQMLQNPLLRLLSQLRFDQFLLAERERDLEATEDFFGALECCGFEASRLKVPTSATNGPLTDAVDISLWRVRHRCIVREPKMQGASAFLAWFLSENPWLCEGQLIELGHGGVLNLTAQDTSSSVLEVEDLEGVDRCDVPLVLLTVDLVSLPTLKRFAERRRPKTTRLLVARDEQEPEILSTFLQEALREGFTFRVLARHRSESSFIGIYSIDFNEPFLHISSFQDTVSISLCCPATWSISLRESCDLWISTEEICLAVEELGWRRRARLPHLVDVDSPKNLSKWRKVEKMLEIQLSTR